MKKLFLRNARLLAAKKEMPWAAKIVKVEGGCMGFESLEDYKVWKNQK